MKSYLDANFLVRLYLRINANDDPRRSLRGADVRAIAPFPVSTLCRLEVRNALQRMVFESRTGGQGRVTPEGAAAAQGDFDEDLATGALLEPVRLTLEELEPQFEQLVGRYTAKHGFRTYDLLHVASALNLGCDTFWSFDDKALKLAKLEGLKTNR